MSKPCYRVVRVSAEGKTLGYTSLMTKRDADRSAALNNQVAGYTDGQAPCYTVVQCASEQDYAFRGETVSPKTGEG